LWLMFLLVVFFGSLMCCGLGGKKQACGLMNFGSVLPAHGGAACSNILKQA
jgi:hypothetical protein